jgi:hypothetical protein
VSEIDVRPAGGGAFRVRVTEGSEETTHEFTVSPEDLAQLGRPQERPEEFVRRCFEFLLAREPKESIMASFDIRTISGYFPEFEQEIRAT